MLELRKSVKNPLDFTKVTFFEVFLSFPSCGNLIFFQQGDNPKKTCLNGERIADMLCPDITMKELCNSICQEFDCDWTYESER